MITDRSAHEELYKKIITRNAQYDDVFFFAVTSTGVYCRPSCPARRPLNKNCQFFISAHEAEKAGFRACKRCRPNLAKADAVILQLHSARSTSLTNAKSIKEAIGVDIGERQIRRLIKNNIGKTPAQILQQRRLIYAYNLLRHTNLPITGIAFRAEFGSVRQFNHAFKQRYRISPSRARNDKERNNVIL